MIIEFLSKINKKFKVNLHKLLNRKLYKNGVILFGIPKLVHRSNIKILKGVRINDNVYLHGAGGIEIGKNVTLSYGVTLLSTGYDTNNWNLNKTEKIHMDNPIKIDDNVWICANVTILDGIKVAEGSIVAAGSVVTKDLSSPGYLYAGVPARKIKKL